MLESSVHRMRARANTLVNIAPSEVQQLSPFLGPKHFKFVRRTDVIPKRRIILPGVLVLGVLIALALVSAKAWTATSSAEKRGSNRIPTLKQFPVTGTRESEPGAFEQVESRDAQRPSTDEQIEVEVITAQANGFEPQEITRPSRSLPFGGE